MTRRRRLRMELTPWDSEATGKTYLLEIAPKRSWARTPVRLGLMVIWWQSPHISRCKRGPERFGAFIFTP